MGYSPLKQALVNHGYVVFDINNRGSSGYGKTFFSLDDRKHGEADLGDVVACRQMLIDTGYVDANKIGIIGGSYGGYMVLAALTLQPDAFKAGVDLFGISNWVRTLSNTPPWWASCGSIRVQPRATGWLSREAVRHQAEEVRPFAPPRARIPR